MIRPLLTAGRPWAVWALLLLLLLLSPATTASHIVGGELDLQHERGSTYRLTLNLYFDDINGSPLILDQDLTASLFAQGSHQRMLDLTLPLTSNTFVAYTSPACAVPNLRTRHLVYSRLLELPAATYTNPLGYYAAVERCCRNRGISNIELPDNAGQTFYLEFPPVVRQGQPLLNSTPRIFPPLSDYACINELFYYDFGGKDADGDSLVYEMATPFNGNSSPDVTKPLVAGPAPYAPIRWNPGFATDNQIAGSPALGIDRRTGRLTVRPARLGLFVFAIQCSEYRKGVKLGEVRRDFQLMVLNCPPNQTPALTVRLPGQTQAYVPGQDVLRLEPGADRCLSLRFTDPDPASQLTLSLHPVNFRGPLPTFTVPEGVVRTAGAPDTLVSQICFPTCLDTKGQVYLLDVIVADNGCSLPRRDTVRVAFIAAPSPNSLPALRTTATQPLRARPGELVTFEVVATDPDKDALTLALLGRGFDAMAMGAQLTTTQQGPELRGRFSWRVPCPTPGKARYEFEFTGSAAPCGIAQAARLVVPIEVDDRNEPPILITTADLARPVVARPGQVLTFDLTATDPENDPLSLLGQGQGFSLQEVGAQLILTPKDAAVQGRFTWVVPCPAAGKLLYNFEFVASSTACGNRQATTLTIPIRIDLNNQPPILTTTASAARPLRATAGQLLTFEVLATDPDNNTLSLTMLGQGFDATSRGAQFTQSPSGNTRLGRFTWRVPCPTADKSVYEFAFTAMDAPCGLAAITTVVIPIQIEYRNAPPTLSSSLFAPTGATPHLVQLVPGSTFEATVEGFDTDMDLLTLTATGVGFDLAAAGMSFVPRTEAGRAAGTFRWNATCDLALASTFEVTFTLQEATCRPEAQQRTVRFTVVSPEQTTFLPPTIFTPNGDGKNDAFELLTLPPDYCAQRFASITVFNRWGKPVYKSDDRSFRWDGDSLPAGVYYYVINYSNQRQFKGHVTLAH